MTSPVDSKEHSERWRMMAMESIAVMEAERDRLKKVGKEKVYRGKPELWRVLDPSFDPAAVRSVQENINDARVVKVISREDTTLAEKKERDMESDAEKDFIELPIKTKYME